MDQHGTYLESSCAMISISDVRHMQNAVLSSALLCRMHLVVDLAACASIYSV